MYKIIVIEMLVLNLNSTFFKEALVAESWNIKPTCLKLNYAITSFLNGKQMKIMNELDQDWDCFIIGFNLNADEALPLFTWRSRS